MASGEREQVLADFQACTQLDDIETCIAILEQNDWNLLQAVQSVMGQSESPPIGGHVQESAGPGPENEYFSSGIFSDPIPWRSDGNMMDSATSYDPGSASGPGTSAGTGFSSRVSDKRMLHFSVEYRNENTDIFMADSETVAQIKETLSIEIGVPVGKQELKGWASRKVTDNTVLRDLHLPKENTLFLLTPELHPSETIAGTSSSGENMSRSYNLKINHKENGRYNQINLKFPGSKTVEEVKRDVFNVTDIPVRHQIWTGWPERTEDSKPIGSIGLSYPSHMLELAKSNLAVSHSSTKPEVAMDVEISEDEEEFHDFGLDESESDLFSHDHIAGRKQVPLSIVEDEINYTDTDAFEDDVQVSLDPSGSKSAKVPGEIIGPTQKGMQELNAETPNLIDDSSGGGVYVNITKDELVNTVFEKAQENTLPSKYIYAGDDEYAQIVKSDKTEETVGEKQKESVNVVQSDDKDVSDTTQQTETVDKETEEIAQDSLVPVEESTTDETVSALECKAAPDSYETTSLETGEDVNEAEIKNTDNGQQNSTAAYSNVIYSDVSFEAELKQIQSKENKIQPDSESDAYVQLEQLVKDHDDVAKTDIPINLDITVADKSNILLQDCETENSKSDEPVTPVSPTVISRASIKLSFKPKVIIMKEVGVQAPDIHMPLDKEFDFGFIKGKPNVVSIGVQVSDSPGITMDKSNDKEDCSTSVTPTAYF